MDTRMPPATLQQQYEGQQAEFDALLSELRVAKARDVPLANVYLSPVRNSPLMLKHDIGQDLLRQLLRHPDYPGDRSSMLSVSVETNDAVYKTTDKDGKEVALSLTGRPRLRELSKRIEREARDLGAKLRSDQRLSLPLFLDYYGLPSTQPESVAAMDSMIHDLQERRARHSLQLFSGFELDDIRRPVTPKDQRMLRLLHRRVPTSSLSMDKLISLLTGRKIIDTVKSFLPEKHTSLLAHLLGEAATDITEEQIRMSPARTLETLFRSAPSQRLIDALLKGLNWFGAAPEEETSPIVRTKLLGKAICLWMTRPDSSKDIAGYAWHHSSHWGKSYPQIWSEFEQHLVASRQAASSQEAILLACLLRPRFPLEFQIASIPVDLTYRSSVVWVNFVHGVHLANAVDPSLLERLTFQRLLELPARLFTKAKQEEQHLIAVTRLGPTLDWAVTNGFIPDREEDGFTREDLEKAVEKLDDAVDDLKYAANMINIRAPERLNIARLKIEKVLGTRYATYNLTDRSVSIGPVHQFGLHARKLISRTHSFVDVYASGKLGETEWFVTQPDSPEATTTWFRINENRTLQSNLGTVPSSLKHPLPDIEATFDTHFKTYVELTRSAYRKLIASLLASLPLADRQILANSSITVYSLRKATSGIEAGQEQASDTMPLRARQGFIVQAQNEGEPAYYEMLPKAGMIRRRPDIEPRHLGALRTSEKWKVSKGSPVSVAVLRHKTLPFDWDAHLHGTPPGANAECEAILDVVGSVRTSTSSPSPDARIPRTLESQATKNITHYLSRNFLFFDEALLRETCHGKTSFEAEQEKKDVVLEVIKALVPFWGSIEDLRSGDRKRWIQGVFGLFTELILFAAPLGKFAAGTLKVARTATTVGFNKALPTFAKLTGAFLQSTLNPLDGIPSLLRTLKSRTLKLTHTGLFKLRKAVGRAGHYRIKQGLPQMDDPGRWAPLSANDELALVKGVEDVPVRNTGSARSQAFHVTDPLTGKPFGPRVALSEVSIGRSTYRSTGSALHEDGYVIAKKARITHVLESDGRTTVWIDDVAYRVQNHALRRVDRLDASQTLKVAHCRIRRTPDELCKTRYVIDGFPAERPAEGRFVEENNWAPWFGDVRVTPSPATSARPRQQLAFENNIYEVRGNALHRGRNTFKAKTIIDAKVEFQDGIFAGLKVNGSAVGVDDVHEVGALIVKSVDGKHRYVFTRLHTDNYYIAKLESREQVQETLRLKKVLGEALSSDTPARELRRIYMGSLNANNLVRIKGRDKVHLALDHLDEYATLIGAPVNPSDELKWVNVTAYSATSLLFDGPTRATAVTLADGANTWSRSTLTPVELQRSVNSTFDALFLRTSDPAALGTAIDTAMLDLQDLTRSIRPSQRNIAYAEVVTAQGSKAIYVSVSGAGDNTRHLPLFKSNAHPVVEHDGTLYFNADRMRPPVSPDALSLTDDQALLAIPHPITDPARPDVLERATSVDSESKLVGYLRQEYPNPGDIVSIRVVTTLPPCDSCSIILKGFGQERRIADLNVIWGRRPNRP